MVRVAGEGRHMQEVLLKDPHTIVIWAKCIFALEMLYLPAVALPKLSILCLYLRIFTRHQCRIFIYILIAVVGCNWLAYAIATTFECRPVAYQWNKTIPNGTCFDQKTFYRLANVPNIVTDAGMLILPLPLVWQLKAPKAQKAGVLIVFLTGSV